MSAFVAQRPHALGVGDDFVVRVHHHHRIDIVAFAIGLGSDLLGFGDHGEAGAKLAAELQRADCPSS